jgi:enterochelin esterase-like enzyme
LPSAVTAQLRRPGPLESRSVAVVVVGAGVVLAAGWTVAAVRWHRQGRVPAHRVARRFGLAGGTAALLVTGGLLAVNSVVGYVPTVGALGDLLFGRSPGQIGGTVQGLLGQRRSGGPWRSRVVGLDIGAPSLDVPALTTYVYLPPGYDDPANARVRYPTVYLIHGYPGSAPDWLRAGRAQQAADLLQRQHLTGPMIMVFPNANGGWLRDSECLNAVGKQQIETYLTTTVVQTIDRTFRTIADRRARAIGGMSSGGYCSLNLGLRHQDVFSTILASEPYGDPGRNVLRSLLAGSPVLFRENSPSDYLPRMRFRYPMAVFLDAGTDDPDTSRAASRLAGVLAHRGQYVALRLARGLGHTWREARAELPYSLVFANQHLTHAA